MLKPWGSAAPQIVDFAAEFTLYPARSTGALRTRALRHYPEHRRGAVSSLDRLTVS
jgi:hypothetical protein